jgi:hypothetical protein
MLFKYTGLAPQCPGQNRYPDLHGLCRKAVFSVANLNNKEISK